MTAMDVLLNKRAEPDRRAPLRQAIDLCRDPIAVALAQNMTLGQIAAELRATWGVTGDVTREEVANLRAGDPARAGDRDHPETLGPAISENTLSRYIQRVRIREGAPDPAAPTDAADVPQTLCPLPRAVHPDWARPPALGEAAGASADADGTPTGARPAGQRDRAAFRGFEGW